MDILADRDLVRVATMYYKEEMKQSDIAKQLGISRQLVSKYLVDARSKELSRLTLTAQVPIQFSWSSNYRRLLGSNGWRYWIRATWKNKKLKN